MHIRRAQTKDIERLRELLSEVLEIHAKIRPDIFISGTTKYTAEELEEICRDDTKPIFVAIDVEDKVMGYVFCIFLQQPFSTNMHPHTSLFIDDFCVDHRARGQHVGRDLYEYVLAFAKERGCYNVTLDVWEGNDEAIAFYERLGMLVKKRQMEVRLLSGEGS